jgi:PAS domain S-box-containing protein
VDEEQSESSFLRSFRGGKVANLKPAPRILLVDDNAEDRCLAGVILTRELGDVRIEEVADAFAFAVAMRGAAVDLVITDHQLAWSDGFSVLKIVQDSRPDVPVIMFTSVRDEEALVRAMKAGLADYLIKSSKGFLKLASAARNALEQADTRQLAARNERWLKTLLECVGVGVFRSTLDERVIDANPAALRLFGVDSMEEALQLHLPAHYVNSGAGPELFQHLNDSGKLRTRVVEFKRRDGSTVWLNLTDIMLLDLEGEMVVDVLVQDVSHLKEHEARLRERIAQLERSNEDLQSFASVASHELREPLRTVSKHTQHLAKELVTEGWLDKENRRSMSFVLASVARMQALIEGLLRFSRISAEGKDFGVCNCNTLVDRAIRSLEPMIKESRATVQREGLPTILGNPAELEHVFQNLISNAIRFRSIEPPQVRVRAVQKNNEWIFSVEDNGIGIDPENTEKIFRIFARLDPKKPGTGIGLALCKRIVERHGGRIWIESQLGEGSTISFSIPVGTHDESGEEQASQPTGRLQSGRK